MNGKEPTEVVRQRLVAQVASSVAGLDVDTARAVLGEIGGLRIPRPIENYWSQSLAR